MNDPVTIQLDKERTLRFTNAAFFRLQKQGVAIEDLADGRKVYAAVCTFIWAMLEGRHPFATPEDLAELVPVANFREQMACVLKAVNAEFAPEDESKKNSGTTPSPSPESNSD